MAETAYVYNGYWDLDLQYLGQYQYHFPKGKVTRIDGKPDHKEIDPNKSEFIGNQRNLAWQLIPLKGESIALEIIENRGYAERGLIVFTDGPDLKKETKDAADQLGLDYRRKEIERFKIGRDKARAGIAGFKLKPDPAVYEWMKEMTPDDEMFGEQHRKADSASQMANAIDVLSRILQAQNQATEVKMDPKPRRKPLEPEEEYAARLKEWEAARG